MESGDEISGNAITEEVDLGREKDFLSRIENLENIVRKFTLATSGDGKVIGGFGRLPRGLSPEERLANIEGAVNAFT